MTRMIFAAAATALTIASPAMAGPETLLEIRKHFAGSEMGNDAVVYDGEQRFSAEAGRISAQISRNDRSNNLATNPTGAEILANNGTFVNDTAARILLRLQDDDDSSNN